MKWCPPHIAGRQVWLLWGLTALVTAAQCAPFVIWPVPDAVSSAATQVPGYYPAGYSALEYAKAHALELSRFWGGWLQALAVGLALLALLASGIDKHFSAASPSKARTWMRRALFLAAVFLYLKALGLPLQYCSFVQNRAIGLTALSVPEWLRLVGLAAAVPLTLFVLKYLVVICLLALCQRLWWVAAALGLFLIGDVAPELVSRTYPLDSIEELRPLERGPHQDAIAEMLGKAGLNLPVMVEDQSRRSRSANLWLTGRAGREYVVITDTFLQDFTPAQVALALAHELGHFRHRLAFLLSDKACALLLLFLIFGSTHLVLGRPIPSVAAAPRIVIYCLLCSLVVSHAFTPLSLALSRSEERSADRYALMLGQDSQEFGKLLLKSATHELEPLDMPAWVYYFAASHPTVLERMDQAARFGCR